MKKYVIYKYTSPSGKHYIGQTCNEERRKYDHKRLVGNCTAFKNAIQKYGYDNFIYEVLERDLTLDEANELEEHYIRELKTLVPNGYNLQSGGENNVFHEETRQKMSFSHSQKIKVDGIEYNNLRDASVSLGFYQDYFGRIIRGKKKNKYGFEIEFLDEENIWFCVSGKEKSSRVRVNGVSYPTLSRPDKDLNLKTGTIGQLISKRLINKHDLKIELLDDNNEWYEIETKKTKNNVKPIKVDGVYFSSMLKAAKAHDKNVNYFYLIANGKRKNKHKNKIELLDENGEWKELL